jgi:hypothetical protein
MKRLLAGALVVALAIGVAGPAVGASPSSLARKAMKMATKANKTAGQAKTLAAQASGSAAHAVDAAQAGPTTVQISSGDVSAPPNDFAEFDVRCPAGFVPTGFGPGLGALEMVAALPTPDGYLASYFNPSSSTSYKGSLYVVCERGQYQSAAAKRLPRRLAGDRLRQAERDRLTRHR